MSEDQFELKSNTLVWLHYNNKKFWEIFISNDNTTISRCGPLVENVEDLNKSRTMIRPHQSIKEAIEYGEFHVQAKLKKGYQIGEKNNKDIADFLSETTSWQSCRGKRMMIGDSCSSYSSSTKKVHIEPETTPFQIDCQPNSINFDIMNDKDAEEAKEGEKEEINVTPKPKKSIKPKLGINLSMQPIVAKNFQGFYITLDTKDSTKFFKVQMLGRHLKVEQGVEGGKIRPQYKSFKDTKEAENCAMKLTLDKVGQGYVFADSKFVFDFEKGELPKTLKYNLYSTEKENSKETPGKAERQKGKRSVNRISISEGYKYLSIPSYWNQQDITGWFMAEKKDGIRCFWNGTELFLPDGTKHKPPRSFSDLLLPVPLDGMLYMAEGTILEIYEMLKAAPTVTEWSKLHFMVYDAPSSDLTFESRLKLLQKEEKIKCTTFFKLAEYTVIKCKDHLLSKLQEIDKANGVGVFLKDPKALYWQGKSEEFLEVQLKERKEAIVVGYEKQEESQDSQIKALKVRNIDDGEELSVIFDSKTSSKQGVSLGSIITYKYDE